VKPTSLDFLSSHFCQDSDSALLQINWNIPSLLCLVVSLSLFCVYESPPLNLNPPNLWFNKPCQQYSVTPTFNLLVIQCRTCSRTTWTRANLQHVRRSSWKALSRCFLLMSLFLFSLSVWEKPCTLCLATRQLFPRTDDIISCRQVWMFCQHSGAFMIARRCVSRNILYPNPQINQTWLLSKPLLSKKEWALGWREES